MKLLKQGFYEIKKSKFYSSLYEIDDFLDYKKVLNFNIKKYKKANHHCFSVICKSETKISNDKEVSNPATQMQTYLKTNKLENHILIVSRIFGGTKLGVGGVGKSFKKSIEEMEVI